MSEQRHLRQELRQGLHQFVMHMYQSYLTSGTEVEAKQLVSEAIKEQLRLFDGSQVQDTAGEMRMKIEELNQELNKDTSYDHQLYYADKIDALQNALEILGYK
jgi:hypothetical protein